MKIETADSNLSMDCWYGDGLILAQCFFFNIFFSYIPSCQSWIFGCEKLESFVVQLVVIKDLLWWWWLWSIVVGVGVDYWMGGGRGGGWYYKYYIVLSYPIEIRKKVISRYSSNKNIADLSMFSEVKLHPPIPDVMWYVRRQQQALWVVTRGRGRRGPRVKCLSDVTRAESVRPAWCILAIMEPEPDFTTIDVSNDTLVVKVEWIVMRTYEIQVLWMICFASITYSHDGPTLRLSSPTRHDES